MDQISKDLSGYKRNLDPKVSNKRRCVSIQEESGHKWTNKRRSVSIQEESRPKRIKQAKMCPDTRGIGTQMQ
ncbi:hypothetical protein COD11_14280 [Bacillus sp. AFS040349]|nr:hypothetical protein COD11_14280 [Bacillus sp. AFS040349]